MLNYHLKGINVLCKGSNEKKVFICLKGPVGFICKFLSVKDCTYRHNKFFFFSKSTYKEFLSFVFTSYKGVIHGYFSELIFVGLGYRFIVQGNAILLKVGFSHYIKIKVPRSIHAFGFKKKLVLFGVDFQEVESFCKLLQKFKRLDVYKGKGICLPDSNRVLKVGKQKI